MKNNFWKEILTSVVLVILLGLLWIFTEHVMPRAIVMTALAGVIIAFGVFASFVLREKAHDEREGYHRMRAGRAAFLSGSVAAIIGIFFQALQHSIDIWLVATLVVMVLAKIASGIYGDLRL